MALPVSTAKTLRRCEPPRAAMRRLKNHLVFCVLQKHIRILSSQEIEPNRIALFVIIIARKRRKFRKTAGLFAKDRKKAEFRDPKRPSAIIYNIGIGTSAAWIRGPNIPPTEYGALLLSFMDSDSSVRMEESAVHTIKIHLKKKRFFCFFMFFSYLCVDVFS